jgi:hypothetical protein
MSFSRLDVEKACLQWEDPNEEEEFFDMIKQEYVREELKKESFQLEGIGDAVFVESTGGHEDDGSYMDVVFKIKDGERDRFFRKIGTYDSWDSPEWDGAFEEVREAKVSKIVWENVNG